MSRLDEGHWRDMVAKPGGPPWAEAMRGLQAELERVRTDAALARCGRSKAERDGARQVFAILKAVAGQSVTRTLSVEFLESIDGPDLFDHLAKLEARK